MRTRLAIALLLTATATAQAQLTITLHTPQNSKPQDAPVYVAGTFNNWDPHAAGFQLSKQSDDAYTITLPDSVRGTVEFKFTLGSWGAAELDSLGNGVTNRYFKIPATGTATYDATVPRWADPRNTKPHAHSASKNVAVLDTAFFIPQLQRSRRVWIYLPAGYATSKARYPVLYLHDGQNVFDNATAYAGEWGVDETLDSLHAGLIVVAVDHGGSKRFDEYSPWKNARYGGGEGDAYVDFLAKTLKPYIDAHFRTKRDRANTGVAGSSMGGLISLYAGLKYPTVFGQVGVFSPALWVAPEVFAYASHAKLPVHPRFYFVSGGLESQVREEQGVYEHLQKAMVDTLIAHGYKPGIDITALIQPDGRHAEWFWRREFPAAYQFLFGLQRHSQLYDPSRDLPGLFHAVQMQRVFADSKTFVDAIPRRGPSEIQNLYRGYGDVKGDKGIKPNAPDPHIAVQIPLSPLKRFVLENFDVPTENPNTYHTDTTQSLRNHIEALWSVLSRPPDTYNPRSSLIPLPFPYVVPGGRFREIYYWDSYFTMIGLIESKRLDLVRGMLDNFAYLVETYGHIPNGNRSYYLSRSQPPFFAAMVSLYAAATDTTQALRYLDALQKEHAFWMEGAASLKPGTAHRRVVKLRDGSMLNRYWDDRAEPRPESYREDYTLAQSVPAAQRRQLYRNIRAAAESGWDFSSRWMRDPKTLKSLETTALIPVDLNSLLYHQERTIAALLRFRGNASGAREYDRAAENRKRALLKLSFDPASGFFFDVRWRDMQRVTNRPTLAAAAPLYFGLATPDQASAVAARLERDFLKDGGFVTTNAQTGQQWDAPNGWAPLEWLAIEGLRRYGFSKLADTARERWLALNERVYHATGRLMEKYDVVHSGSVAGGGEYPNQDGFGWTNGVALGLMRERNNY